MEWLAAIFRGIGNLLSPILGGSFRKENRADFTQVTDMWEKFAARQDELEKKQDMRYAVLEAKLDAMVDAERKCRVDLNAAIERIALLERQARA